ELSTVLLLHLGGPDALGSGPWALPAVLTPGSPLSALRRATSSAAARCLRSVWAAGGARKALRTSRTNAASSRSTGSPPSGALPAGGRSRSRQLRLRGSLLRWQL